MASALSTLHGSAVLIGAGAVLIRGPAGSGKSSLALELIEAGRCGSLPFSRLIADDRVLIVAAHGRVLASAPPQIAGLLEVRGLGLRRMPFESRGVVRLVVDLAATSPRLPDPGDQRSTVAGVALPRIAAASPESALRLLAAWRATEPAEPSPRAGGLSDG
ncbi:MAG: hypothetical protein IT204_26440 [Fimbriimonadaceae bacterium]|nr:hypothetical protein [Fimbriimonadaceae bacterium]